MEDSRKAKGGYRMGTRIIPIYDAVEGSTKDPMPCRRSTGSLAVVRGEAVPKCDGILTLDSGKLITFPATAICPKCGYLHAFVVQDEKIMYGVAVQ